MSLHYNSNNPRFKTIDELVEYYEMYYTKQYGFGLSIIHTTIVSYQLVAIRDTLKSASNKPSRHDIMLIQEINKSINSRATDSSKQYIDLVNEVLSVYINRK